MFKINDKVVCINDKGLNFSEYYYQRFYEGKVYTVSSLDSSSGAPFYGFYVTGIRGKIGPDGNEYSIDSYRFRKLEDIKEENRLKNQQFQTL